jgi:hypothetical protein
MREGAVYRANEAGDQLHEFPALQCEACHNLEPDTRKIARLPENDVPSSLKIRCALVVQHESGKDKADERDGAATRSLPPGLLSRVEAVPDDPRFDSGHTRDSH